MSDRSPAPVAGGSAAGKPPEAPAGVKSEWGRPRSADEVLRQMGSPDLPTAAGAWALAADEADADPRVEDEACFVLDGLHPFEEAHVGILQVVLGALLRKNHPLRLKTLVAAGRFVSGRSEQVRLMAVTLLGRQHPAPQEALAAAGLTACAAFHRQTAWEFAASAMCDGSPLVLRAAMEACTRICPEPLVLAELLRNVQMRAMSGHYNESCGAVWASAAEFAAAAAVLPDESPMPQHRAVARAVALFGLTSTDSRIQQASAYAVSATRPVAPPQ